MCVGRGGGSHRAGPTFTPQRGPVSPLIHCCSPSPAGAVQRAWPGLSRPTGRGGGAVEAQVPVRLHPAKYYTIHLSGSDKRQLCRASCCAALTREGTPSATPQCLLNIHSCNMTSYLRHQKVLSFTAGLLSSAAIYGTTKARAAACIGSVHTTLHGSSRTSLGGGAFSWTR